MIVTGLDVSEPMLVKHVMTSPVITVDENENVKKVAQIMDSQKVGCIIVTGKDEKPLGIITERDLVTRVLAKNTQDNKLTARKVMSSPLNTIDPEASLIDAARRMSHLNIRRLGVVYRGKLEGIISSKDILAITPELIEIIQQKAQLLNAEIVEEHIPSAGYCDQCAQWSDELKEYEGSFLCEDCRSEFEIEY